ncbi:MAG: glutamate--tRNA ligase [Verrucomicrobiae bacterium]|nr:glutamate--tRNA ligase [Verrucomicrobiae bacterium]
MTAPIRVRFAPSPTGLLHIGGARTALFNWLYARHTGGTLVLRIEDTDEARNTQEAIDIIFKGLKWLGLNWDEGPDKDGDYGPYFQSQRKSIYQRYIQKLLDEGKAYEQEGAIRFRTPKTLFTFHDLICGDITFDRTTDPDLVIQRSNGVPVFHFVNVIDDLEMKITHVIRGEDHISNTPKHIALFEALGATPPHYGHIPLILNVNGSKMSKRDIGASVGDYMHQHYCPEALRNYLCLLGWSLKENREIFPIEEAIEKFDLPQVNRGNARFDTNKLYWMNGEYLRAKKLPELTAFAKPILQEANVIPETVSEEYLGKVLQLVQEKVKLGRDFPEWTRYFFGDNYPIDEKAAALLQTSHSKASLTYLHNAFEALSEFTSSALENALKKVATETNQKTGALIHPCRAAVTGSTIGPSLYHLLEVLGKDRVLSRLAKHRSPIAS